MELIDRQALKAAHGLGTDCCNCKQSARSCQYDMDFSRMDFCEWLDDAPTIDAVFVVRCKDCKWYSIYEAKKDGTPDKRYRPSVCLREIYAKRRDPDWFCADGEREVQE